MVCNSDQEGEGRHAPNHPTAGLMSTGTSAALPQATAHLLHCRRQQLIGKAASRGEVLKMDDNHDKIDLHLNHRQYRLFMVTSISS
jgi:hypothetical protein